MTSPGGLYDWLALAAVLVAIVSLGLLTWTAFALRRLRRAQKIVLGGSERDILRHAADMQREFVALRDWIDESGEAIDRRMAAAEQRLDRSIAHSAMIRYDAYGEMTGRQSSSVALVDDKGNGLVITAIRHRSHSHLYVKQLRDGDSDIDLSPEEREVLERAFADNPLTDPPAGAPPQPPRGAESQTPEGAIRVRRNEPDGESAAAGPSVAPAPAAPARDGAEAQPHA